MIKFKQVGKWAKDKTVDTYRSTKHAITNPKETAIKIGKYIKDNPDEALVVGAAEGIPPIMMAKAIKDKDTKAAATWGAASAAPIGVGYVAGKKGIKALLKKSKSMSNSDKEDLRNTDMRDLSIKDKYKAKAVYLPVTAATYIGGRMIAKKLGAGKNVVNYSTMIPAIAAGRLTKKAVVGKLKISLNKEN